MAIYDGASDNTIGGTVPGSGNVISANLGFGVYISDVGTDGNLVAGDDIGTDASGMLPLGNGLAGVIMQYGASDNTIGGTSPNARDVISANTDGVDIAFGGTTGNVVEGDDIGVTADGAGPLGNAYSGVAIFGGAGGNIIGGTVPARATSSRPNQLLACISRTSGRTATWWKATTSAPMPPACSHWATAWPA